MASELGSVVLKRLGVRPVFILGGRLNRHWLVEHRREECVLRRWNGDWTDARYESALMDELYRAGCPVAQPLGEPIEQDGAIWSLFSRLPGITRAENGRAEQRERGRLLAEFHARTSGIAAPGPREGFRRCEVALADTQLDSILQHHERVDAEEARIVRWHLDKVRERADLAALAARQSVIVHGDFAGWNLLFEGDRLSGILDLELSRSDHFEADFALAWRGKYDDVIAGYGEVTPLQPDSLERTTIIWWTGLIELACRQFRQGIRDDGWIMTKLLLRSPIMGRFAEPYG